MRPIDADALIKILEPHSLRNGAVLGWHSGLIDAVIDEIRKIPTIGGWISVKDKLPEINEPILFTGKNTIGNRYPAQKGYFSGDEWYSFGLIDKCSDGVTHWMPLPEPPEEEK